MYSLSHVWLFAAPWTVAHQVPLSLKFSRQDYWSGLSFPSPEDLPNPGIKPRSPTLQADSLLSEPLGKPIIVAKTMLKISNKIMLKNADVRIETQILLDPQIKRNRTISMFRKKTGDILSLNIFTAFTTCSAWCSSSDWQVPPHLPPFK